MKMKKKKASVALTALLGVVTVVSARAEPESFEWSSTTGFIMSPHRDAIETITGQAAFSVNTPVGIRWIVPGNMSGTFTYDRDNAGPPQPRGTAVAYKGPNLAWSSQLLGPNGLIGTFTGDVGELIVRNGDGAPGGDDDLVNVNMCGFPCGDGVVPFSVGPWQARNSSVVWIGEGFQDDLSLPVALPPAGAPQPLGLFGFFNTLTGENINLITIDVDIRQAVQSVVIDVKPGSDPNCFNVNGHGVIPVAILGSAEFDVTAIDHSSLSFGGLGVRVRGNRYPQCSVEYSNGDPHLDLVCHFEDDSGAWVEGGDEATLTGTLVSGDRFEGSDSICLVP